MQQPLIISGISKSFNDFKAVQNLSFSLEQGEVLGIVGPNGAGKTTTIKMILGLLQPDKGSINILGSNMTDPKVRSQIGYMPETPSFYKYLTGRELLVMVAKLFSIPKPEAAKRVTTLLQKVGLKDAANRKIGGYSKGMLQRICLAQALINEPRLLFLDEPLDGLDPIGRVRMREILLDIKATGTAIVLNSHILSDVEVMSDKIAIMDHGKIVRLDTVKNLIPAGKTLEEVFIEVVDNAD